MRVSGIAINAGPRGTAFAFYVRRVDDILQALGGV